MFPGVRISHGLNLDPSLVKAHQYSVGVGKHYKFVPDID